MTGRWDLNSFTNLIASVLTYKLHEIWLLYTGRSDSLRSQTLVGALPQSSRFVLVCCWHKPAVVELYSVASVNFGKVIIGCVASCLSKAQSSLLDTEIVFRCLASSPSTLLKLLHRLSASLVGDHSLVGVLSSNYSNTWIPANSHGIFMTSNFAWVATTSVDWITIELNWMLKKFRTELQWESGIEWILVKIWFSKKFIVIWLNGEKDN